jgi:long-chain acyl-CoA synthetase
MPIETPATIAALPFFASGRFPRAEFIGRCHPDRIDYVSGRELIEKVRDLSLGLSSLGMAKGDRVVLLAESRPEWLFLDLAILTAGAITTPIYPSASIDQVRQILDESGAALAVVSNGEHLDKLAAAASGLPALRAVVGIDPIDDAPARTPPGASFVPLDAVRDRGHQRIMSGWGVAREYHDIARSITPDDPATLIYTSGTTGTSRGVLLTHGNLAANLAGIVEVFDLHEGDVALSFLPLCHAFERIVSYVYLTTGVSVVFAESVDTVARDLLRVRPTVMTAVPRVFEKLYARIVARGHEARGIRRGLFDWGVGVAQARGARLSEGQTADVWLRAKSALADAVLFRRVREGLGGRLRYAVSGGAPLPPLLGRFFYGLGFPIHEGYGLTETSPVLCVMPLGRVRFGSVGQPLSNVELRIAADGEILARGPNVMAGYWQRPEETAAALRDGWFHTGDIGVVDADGFVRVTDRKKELLVTSGGKKIAAQTIENTLKTSPAIEEAVVIAEGRRFPSALLVPDLAAAARELGGEPPRTGDVAAFLERSDVVALFARVVDAVNAPLAQFERIKKFALLPVQFTVEGGELTPTLKVKRRVVEERFRGVIEKLYDD